jgi:hypothetical protein
MACFIDTPLNELLVPVTVFDLSGLEKGQGLVGELVRKCIARMPLALSESHGLRHGHMRLDFVHVGDFACHLGPKMSMFVPGIMLPISLCTVALHDGLTVCHDFQGFAA